ncbi:MAG: endonuclease MutS2 [Oscillospiraceae bacterium]|nr:endonuclease MutS2 [Oscillospiraceae bacterium]
MTFFEKSCITLELPAVLAMLAEEAGSEGAKQAIAALVPETDLETVRDLMEQTSAAKKLMETRGSPSFGGIRDITGSVRRADMGGALNPAELLYIATVLRVSGAVAGYKSGESESTAIDHLFWSLRGNKYLESRITSSIISPEEIADNASSTLADIRRHIRKAGERVRQSLNKIISSTGYAKALQEPIITMRNNRYVVPVKADHKSEIPGLVHDVSASGATLFVEPVSAVQANNEIRELEAQEKKEIERILMELSAEVAQHGEDIITDYQTLLELDVIFAKAKLSYRMKAGAPAINGEGRIMLRRARHPLLDPKKAVPIDVRLGDDFDTLVITGPNTGGKTVTLKTIGLFCAMAQCGLHIPADDGSCVGVFEQIMAEIGDEQSIEQSLSTFSSHMTNIVRILEECTDNALVLFDELGAGTDPVEGAALAIAIIERVRGIGARIAATTHYAELKIYAMTTPGVMNASCEFDVETLSPTYRLLIGVPGKSNAFAISRRLGLDGAVIEDAKARIDGQSASFEEVLSELEKKRREMEDQHLETQRLLEQAKQAEQKAEENRKQTDKQRENAAKIARREADDILLQARQAAEEVYAELDAMRKKARSKQPEADENSRRAELMHKINESRDNLRQAAEDPALEPLPDRPIQAGDRVKLLRVGTAAEVISVNRDGTLTLQAGIMKVTARPGDVQLLEGVNDKEKKKALAGASTGLRSAACPMELDVRGMMTDEVVPVVQRYLDNARMSKLNQVTIIHGKGTGALRKAVQDCLCREKGVKSYRLGVFGEGESGVTVVELKS